MSGKSYTVAFSAQKFEEILYYTGFEDYVTSEFGFT